MPVPKIIHQFWDKNEPPDDVAERLQTWKAHHPDWQYRLWNDDSASEFLRSEFGMEAALCFHAAKLPAMRADILRIGVGLAMGGAYADADMACAGPLGDLTTGRGALRVGPGKKTGRDKLANNFFAVEARTEFFQEMWKQVIHNINKGVFHLLVSRLSGPNMWTFVWHRRISEAERSAYKLIPDDELSRYVGRGGRLAYRKDGDHWTDEISARRIIDFQLGNRKLRSSTKGHKRSAASGTPMKKTTVRHKSK